MRHLPRTVAALALLAPAAHAHPLGPSSIDRLAALEVRVDSVQVRYTLDLAAQPAERALPEWQRDPDGYAQRRAAELGEGLALTVDENGAPALRVEVRFDAPAAFGIAARRVTFADGNYPIYKGRRQATVAAGPGLAIPDAPKAPAERLQVTVAPTARQTGASAAALGLFLATAALGMVRRQRR